MSGFTQVIAVPKVISVSSSTASGPELDRVGVSETGLTCTVMFEVAPQAESEPSLSRVRARTEIVASASEFRGGVTRNEASTDSSEASNALSVMATV